MDSRLLWGTVEMLILEVLADGPSYGYQITQAVLTRSKDYFNLTEGSLYPCLHRMQRRKWLEANWVDAPESRRRKYYKLTRSGRTALAKKRQEWQSFTTAVDNVMGVSHAMG